MLSQLFHVDTLLSCWTTYKSTWFSVFVEVPYVGR